MHEFEPVETDTKRPIARHAERSGRHPAPTRVGQDPIDHLAEALRQVNPSEPDPPEDLWAVGHGLVRAALSLPAFGP